MDDIVKRIENLPVNPEDLSRWILIGKVKLAAQIAAIKAISKLEDGVAAHAGALSDTQDLGEELLYAEARMGSMLAATQPKPKPDGSGKGTFGGRDQSLPDGIDKKQSHYAQTLSRNEDKIAEVVAKAREEGEVPVRQHVLREIRKSAPKRDPVPMPEGQFNVIYADPPWCYGDKLIEGYGAAEHHYPAMSIEDLCAMDIPVTDDAILFLWVTSPLLEDSFQVISSWGFQYKTSFVWDKQKHNYGHYNSVRHEFLLICTRGSMLPEDKTLHDSVVSIERTKHSEKPEYFRDLIEKMYPNGAYLELFGRKKVKGWAVYGNDPKVQ